MEIVLENKIKLDSYGIIGVMDNKGYLIKYFRNIGFDKNNIILDNKKVIQKDLINFKRRVSIIENYVTDDLNLTVYEYMKSKIFESILDIRDYRKKIKDSLKIVGLSETYLDKKVLKLSKIEIQWVSFAIGLCSNPDIIVLNRVFHSLDIKNTKKLIDILSQLTEKYHKIIVICTNDAEVVYKYTKDAIIIKDNDVLISGKSEDIFQNNYELLLKNNISIPKTIEFSYLVNNKKNVHLGYFKDIRDLIKDIYKKV